MRILNGLISLAIATTLISSFAADEHSGPVKPEPYTLGKTLTKHVQAGITPKEALNILKAGNARFVSGQLLTRSPNAQVTQTALGQFPFASVLACIDSRSSPEHVFDLGVGDIFSARIAGNTINEDILGSLEYASWVAGSRLIVVLGHTNCGAIKGACDGVQMGNLTTLLEKLQPAVRAASTPGEHNSKNHTFVDEVTELNVNLTIQAIRANSPILRQLEQQGKIKIVGAIYDTGSGKVSWQ